VPKRTEVRRRRNKDADGLTTVRGRAADSVTVPPADPDWHPVARSWYLSLQASGQSHWYEPSDWAFAVYVAEAMSRNLQQGGRMSAQMFAAVMSAMTELLTTEGARRRVRMELAKDEPTEDASVTAIDDYRKMLS
jgi:hypothetical protein